MTSRLVATALTAALALAAVGGPSAAAEAADTGGLVLHYDFEGSLSGGVVTDRSGSGLDGTLVNPSAAGTTAGPDGSQALLLPGGAAGSTTAPYVSLPNGLFKDLSAATVSTWVKWAGGDDFQWVYCIGKNQDTATFITPSFSGVSRTRSSIKPVNGNSEVGVTASRKLPTDQWVNLVTTIDGKTISYYIDGVKIGSTAAVLDLAATMYSSTNTTSGFLGKPFWGGHPFLAGALDDFRVYNTAFDDAGVAALAGDHLATLTGTGATTFDVTTTVGTAPNLPAVTASYSDGIDRDLPVAWDAVDPTAYAQRGTFTVTGAVTGTTLTATAHVTVVAPGDLDIDLGTDTGAFHGGASGTLYGLYGDGVPSHNLIEGMNLRTVSTKAQDGPQHPGADALEVVKPLADATGGDVYIYMTDIYRGFPYQWPGDTPQAKLDDYLGKIAEQVDQVLTLPAKYQQHIVFVPFNEPEGNMFGTGDWSYNKISWLTDPQYYYAAWDRAYKLIKGKMPGARIAGPNTSVLYDQVKAFLTHALAADTLPDVITWHELSNPAAVRTSVARYRGWENEILGGRHLPININEYAFNYHTSVPGQMIQWISAIEESKVDADIAYWNIDGNISDSAVQANRANGQWWLLNAYGQMTGHTVQLTPMFPDVSYTMQGVATVDTAKRQARALFGGASGEGAVTFRNAGMFGGTVHASIREIPWTGQIGDSAQPRVVAELDRAVSGGSVSFDFGADLPKFDQSSAYEIILTPGGHADRPEAVPPTLWSAGYEAENAAHTGSGWSLNGPEGTPSDVSKFYTSGGYDVGGLRTGSDVVLNFPVTAPQDGVYDLSVFANSLNTYGLVADQGPTNVFLRVDGTAEQELDLPLGYKWVVWDHTDTTVSLTKGDHVISLAARSLDGTKATKGDAIVDRITLALPNPAASQSVYDAAYATLDGAGIDHNGRVALDHGQSATFWVYSADDSEHTLDVDAGPGGSATLTVNGNQVAVIHKPTKAKVFLSGGVNKVTVTGASGTFGLDRIRVEKTTGTLTTTWYEAEAATVTGSATAAAYSLASGGKAVTGIGGDPGNGNTLTFDVQAPAAGTYAMTVRYSNPEQSPASHYNPDPLARHADISVNGAQARPTLFPHTFHGNNFWYLTVPVTLTAGHNTIRFSSQEQPDFNGTTYISDRYTEPLRSKYAPNIDKIGVTPLTTADTTAPTGTFTLDHDKVWPGQKVTLTQTALADDTSEAAAISRVVTWGDGTAPETLPAGRTTATHTYAGTGGHPVSVRLTDEAGNSAAATISGPSTVTVTAQPGRFSLDRTAIWASQPVQLNLSGVTGATKIVVSWGDGGNTTISPNNGFVAHAYAKAGTFPVKVTPYNAAGAGTPVTAGTVKVTKDTFKPTVSLTVPTSPATASSWTKLSGTASDKGLGVAQVRTKLIEKRSGKWYYYNGKTWAKAGSQSVASAKAKVITVTPNAKGVWSLRLNGVKTGSLKITYGAQDKAGNASTTKVYTKKITK